jgi:prevent-host-death family protein
MSVHTYSSRSFTRDVGAAKRAAQKGPVFITDRGRPAFALLKIEDYYQLAGQQEASLLDVMDAIACEPMDGLAGEVVLGGGIEFDPPRLQVKFRTAKLS